MNYIETNDLGTYASIEALWAAHPEGGHEGDYCTIGTTKYRWDKYDRMWIADPNFGPTQAREMKTFDGDVTIQNNLTVAGTIRAAAVKQPCVGLFATVPALEAAYPSPEVGMWAVVGNTMPGPIYRCSVAGSWSATGEDGGVDEIDLTDYAKEEDLEALEERVDDIETSIYSEDMVPPTLVRELPSYYLSTNDGEIHAGAATVQLNTYKVEAGKKYYIHISNGTSNSNVYLYNWYATLENAQSGTNGLATVYQRSPVSIDLEVEAPTGANYLNVSFFVESTKSVDTGMHKTKFYDHEDRIEDIEETLENLPSVDAVEPLEKVNLFTPECVMEGYLMDTSNGKYTQTTIDGRCFAVARVPASYQKYYCIYNPYHNYLQSGLRVGVQIGESDYGNYSQDNIVVYDSHWIIAQAVWTNGSQVGPTITSISFQLYMSYTPKPNALDTPLVQVYEMDSYSEAVQWLRAKGGQSHRLNDVVSIEQTMLSSNVATLTSAYGDKSVVVFGDSLSQNHSWSEYMMNTLKLRNVFNFAIGGASMQYNRAGADLLSQVNGSAEGMKATCYLQGKLQDGVYVYPVDCVFISMGHNDVGPVSSHHVLGDVTTIKNTAWESLAPTGESFASVLAGFKYCLFRMKTTIITSTATINGNTVTVGVDYRNAKFIYQSPIQTLRHDTTPSTFAYSFAELRAAMKELCEYYAVPYVDGWTESGITIEEELLYATETSTNVFTEGKYLKDGVHPTEIGYLKLGAMNTSALLNHFI